MLKSGLSLDPHEMIFYLQDLHVAFLPLSDTQGIFLSAIRSVMEVLENVLMWFHEHNHFPNFYQSKVSFR